MTQSRDILKGNNLNPTTVYAAHLSNDDLGIDDKEVILKEPRGPVTPTCVLMYSLRAPWTRRATVIDWILLCVSTAAPQSGQKEGQAELVVYRAKENVPVSVKALVVFLGHANCRGFTAWAQLAILLLRKMGGWGGGGTGVDL